MEVLAIHVNVAKVIQGNATLVFPNTLFKVHVWRGNTNKEIGWLCARGLQGQNKVMVVLG
jgi:hypothetical protein